MVVQVKELRIKYRNQQRLEFMMFMMYWRIDGSQLNIIIVYDPLTVSRMSVYPYFLLFYLIVMEIRVR